MTFDLAKHPLAVKAFAEVENVYKTAGAEIPPEIKSAQSLRQLELLEQYIDGSLAERESLIAASILLLSGPGHVKDRDVSGYGEQFNGRVAEIVQELHDKAGPTADAGRDFSKALQQIIAANQMAVFEYFMSGLKDNPDYYRIDSTTPENAKYARFIRDAAFNEGVYAADPPKGSDLGAPRLKAFIKDELNAYYAEIAKINNPSPPAAPAPPAKNKAHGPG